MSAHSSAVSSTVSPSSSIALVTGATGFVAVHVIQQLLSKDYTVRGTVRSIKDAKAVDLVHDFPSLSLFEADLMQPTSFDQAIDGARFIFHIASPAMLTADDAQRSIIDPAVNGTATVVSAALRTPSVERIIVTSSIATFLDPSSPAGRVYTESDWNLHWPAEHAPYQLSKVLAEQKAWDLVNAHNAQPDQRHPVRLITILPSTVLGPPIGRRIDGFSVSIITDLLNGSQVEGGVFPSNFPDVDVRDVATAHIVAAELKGANGRYIVSGTSSGHTSGLCGAVEAVLS